MIEMILYIAGFSLSTWMIYGCCFPNGPIVWRYLLAFQFVFMVVLFSTVSWLLESPNYAFSNPSLHQVILMKTRWLLAHDKEDEVFQILVDLENQRR